MNKVFGLSFLIAVQQGFSVIPQTGAGGSIGTFSKLRDIVYTNGNGAIYILLILFGVIAVLSLMIAAVGVMYGGSRERAFSKNNIIWVIVIAAFGFSVIGIVTTLASIADKLF